MIDGRTCRAARGFLNWTSRTLAAKSGVPVSRIFEIERDRPIANAHVRALQETFLRHGVAVTHEGTRAVGIREAPGSAHAIGVHAIGHRSETAQPGDAADRAMVREDGGAPHS